MTVSVVAFVMDGCHACEELKPALRRIAEHYKGCIPTQEMGVFTEMASTAGVNMTPTVCAFVDGKQRVRMVGYEKGEEHRLERLYRRAMELGGSACDVEAFEWA